MKSISFIGGFMLGLLCISLVQAALPKRVTPQTSDTVSELHAEKVTAPDLEKDFARLERAEKQYAESWDQQQKIRAATQGLQPRPAARRVLPQPGVSAFDSELDAQEIHAPVKPLRSNAVRASNRVATELPREKKRPTRE